jgi:hypothetical protein
LISGDSGRTAGWAELNALSARLAAVPQPSWASRAVYTNTIYGRSRSTLQREVPHGGDQEQLLRGDGARCNKSILACAGRQTKIQTKDQNKDKNSQNQIRSSSNGDLNYPISVG